MWPLFPEVTIPASIFPGSGYTMTMQPIIRYLDSSPCNYSCQHNARGLWPHEQAFKSPGKLRNGENLPLNSRSIICTSTVSTRINARNSLIGTKDSRFTRPGALCSRSYFANSGLKWPKILFGTGKVFKAKSAMVSSVGDLYEFICRGTLVEKTGSNPREVADHIDIWLEAGLRVCRLLGLNELILTEAEKARVYHYYVPVYLWCLREVMQHRAKFGDAQQIPPLVIGVSAPQGSGKTTLVYILEHLFNVAGRRATSISIDDFYLTATDQGKLAAENPGNTLLELRGNAGSHDLAFGTNTLKTLCSLVKEGTKAKVPRYDKSANNGRGDRAEASTWPEIEGPLEVIFFEGWMLGFKPLPGDFIKALDPQLGAVNRNLESYYDAWEKFIDSWIVVEVDDPQRVYKWRLQAEVAMREEGKPGMSDEQVADFVSRYMPAYKAYLPTLYSDGPNGSKPEHTLVVKVDEQRNPVG